MRFIFLFLIGSLMIIGTARSQCTYLVNEFDPFDSTQIVSVEPFNIGYLIPSAYVEEDGNIRMVEEAKLMLSYTENDSISSFFLTIAALERDFFQIKGEREIVLLLNNGHVIPLLNVPDRGAFNSQTNMRLYNHVCVIPLDVYYSLTYHSIDKIRINYKGYKRTLVLTPEQKLAVQDAIRCVGQAAELFPIRP